jgi:hypothetical protein
LRSNSSDHGQRLKERAGDPSRNRYEFPLSREDLHHGRPRELGQIDWIAVPHPSDVPQIRGRCRQAG